MNMDVRGLHCYFSAIEHAGIKGMSNTCHVFDRTGSRPTEVVERDVMICFTGIQFKTL